MFTILTLVLWRFRGKSKLGLGEGLGMVQGLDSQGVAQELRLGLDLELGVFGKKDGEMNTVRTAVRLELATLGAGKIRIQDPKVQLGD